MPPNRKAHTEISREIASTLKGFLAPGKSVDVSGTTTAPPAFDSKEYWEWKTSEGGEIDFFSADRITANLLKASRAFAQANSLKTTTHENDTVMPSLSESAAREYWFMPSRRRSVDVVDPSFQPGHSNLCNMPVDMDETEVSESDEDDLSPYWQWDSWKYQARENRARTLVSPDRMVAAELKRLERIDHTMTGASTHEGDLYWACRQ